MPVDEFNIKTCNKIKNIEFLRGKGWEFDFIGAMNNLKYADKYNEIWQMIKKKNNW